MSIAFSESETLQNLMRAFAGESQARNRYTFAASVCKKQNLHVLESVFLFTANQELAHAQIFHQHLSAMNGKDVPVDGAYPVTWTSSPADLLRQAQKNETKEHEEVYPAFAEIAQKEGYPLVANSFREIAVIEGAHSRRFAQLADWLEAQKLFVSGADCGWMCLNCGHIVHGPEAPKVCPVCQHDQGFFVRLDLAPFSDSALRLG